jgi:preprotein translocase subunit SecG
VQIVSYVLIGLLLITSFLMTLLILLHKGRGGGMSDMFGGGFSSSLGGSSLAEKNLDRLTVAVALVWAAAIIAVGILITAL